MVYYDPIKVTINAPSFVEVIINIVVQYHDLFHSVVSDYDLIITWSFGHQYAIFLKSSGVSQLPFIYKQIVRQRGKIIL